MCSSGTYQLINEKLIYISGCFYYFTSTVNPILYNVMSVKYRCGVRITLSQIWVASLTKVGGGNIRDERPALKKSLLGFI